MIKGSIQEKYIAIVSIYAPNIGASQYVKQMLTAIKGEIAVTHWLFSNILFSLHVFVFFTVFSLFPVTDF